MAPEPSSHLAPAPSSFLAPAPIGEELAWAPEAVTQPPATSKARYDGLAREAADARAQAALEAEAQEAAAVKMQASMRGRFARQETKALAKALEAEAAEQEAAAVKVQASMRGRFARQETNKAVLDARATAPAQEAARVEAEAKAVRQAEEAERKLEEARALELAAARAREEAAAAQAAVEEAAAVRLQGMMRAAKGLYRVLLEARMAERAQEAAAARVQAMVRSKLAREEVAALKEARAKAEAEAKAAAIAADIAATAAAAIAATAAAIAALESPLQQPKAAFERATIDKAEAALLAHATNALNRELTSPQTDTSPLPRYQHRPLTFENLDEDGEAGGLLAPSIAMVGAQLGDFGRMRQAIEVASADTISKAWRLKKLIELTKIKGDTAAAYYTMQLREQSTRHWEEARAALEEPPASDDEADEMDGGIGHKYRRLYMPPGITPMALPPMGSPPISPDYRSESGRNSQVAEPAASDVLAAVEYTYLSESDRNLQFEVPPTSDVLGAATRTLSGPSFAQHNSNRHAARTAAGPMLSASDVVEVEQRRKGSPGARSLACNYTSSTSFAPAPVSSTTSSSTSFAPAPAPSTAITIAPQPARVPIPPPSPRPPPIVSSLTSGIVADMLERVVQSVSEVSVRFAPEADSGEEARGDPVSNGAPDHGDQGPKRGWGNIAPPPDAAPDLTRLSQRSIRAMLAHGRIEGVARIALVQHLNGVRAARAASERASATGSGSQLASHENSLSVGGGGGGSSTAFVGVSATFPSSKGASALFHEPSMASGSMSCSFMHAGLPSNSGQYIRAGRSRHGDAVNGDGGDHGDGKAPALEADGSMEAALPASHPDAPVACVASGDLYGLNQLSCGSAVYSGYDAAGGEVLSAEAACATSDFFIPNCHAAAGTATGAGTLQTSSIEGARAASARRYRAGHVLREGMGNAARPATAAGRAGGRARPPSSSRRPRSGRPHNIAPLRGVMPQLEPERLVPHPPLNPPPANGRNEAASMRDRLFHPFHLPHDCGAVSPYSLAPMAPSAPMPLQGGPQRAASPLSPKRQSAPMGPAFPPPRPASAFNRFDQAYNILPQHSARDVERTLNAVDMYVLAKQERQAARRLRQGSPPASARGVRGTWQGDGGDVRGGSPGRAASAGRAASPGRAHGALSAREARAADGFGDAAAPEGLLPRPTRSPYEIDAAHAPASTERPRPAGPIITDPWVYLDRSAKAARTVQASVDAAWRRELQNEQVRTGRRASSARSKRGTSMRQAQGGPRGAAKKLPQEALELPYLDVVPHGG